MPSAGIPSHLVTKSGAWCDFGPGPARALGRGCDSGVRFGSLGGFVNKKIKLALIAGLAYVAGGCSLLSEYRAVDTSAIRNPEGHVVGQKETLKYRGSGEE